MITAHEAVEDVLRLLEHALEAAKSAGEPIDVESVDGFDRGMNAGLDVAIRAIQRERENARRTYAPKGAEVEQYMFMRLHTPVRKA